VIGRDHLDSGSVASPNRETEGMKDGTDAVSDWAILNALINAVGGATWVSFHHGGGVGMGYSQHAGQVIVADGTPEAARRLERVLTTDPGLGVVRHADAGYEIAIEALFVLLVVAGCNSEPEPTPTTTTTPEPPPLAITYCDIDRSDLCLEGFGLDNDERLLILFKADDRLFANIYIRSDGPDGEMIFECRQSEDFLENVYCLGDEFTEGESVKLNIHSKRNDRLIALGVFNVQYTNLPTRDVVFEVDATQIPSPAIAAEPVTPTLVPSYTNPSYPNPAYPNPTSAP
jgi:hypothetical protein